MGLSQEKPAAHEDRHSERQEPAVRLQALTKRFEEVTAVDDLTLDVANGEFLTLLGPSGCGKTTTLRMIGGFEEPTAGTVHLAGRDVTGLPPYRRNVNTVFQSYALFPHLDVFENVAFGLRRKQLPKHRIENGVEEALRLVDLAGYGKRKPAQLSGGQQQRVALARALVNRPQVLLLDEPLGALDLKLRKQMQLELKRIQEEVGITFLYVTHDQEEAMTMSDRIAVMRRGKVEQLGAPEEVYERPRTEFVAGFVGAANLLDAEIQVRDPEVATLEVGQGVLLRVPSEAVPDGSIAVKIGVRPEKIRLRPVDAPPPEGWNRLPGRLVLETFIGVGHHYEIEGPGGRRIAAYEQNVGERSTPRVGEQVSVLWRSQDTFVVRPDRTDRQLDRVEEEGA